MKLPVVLKPHLSRFSKQYPLGSAEIPAALLSAPAEKPDLSDFPLPLPSKKDDYCCSAVSGDGAQWFGASTGLTRYDPKAEKKIDRVMFFSFERDLPSNSVERLLATDNGVWALTDKGAAKIEMKVLNGEQKAAILLDESLKYVSRRGMMSQKYLAERGNVASAIKHGESDNDGTFTAGFAAGELFRYAVLKREKGASAPETLEAKKVATRAVEACLLLMYIHRRGNGFVARTYLCPEEPVPDDGLFFRISNDKATAIETSFSKRKGIAGLVIDASAPVPARLAKLYEEWGCDGEGIVYKADTSSDEITSHYFELLLAHQLLGDDDSELDAMIKECAAATMAHIIDNGFELHDCTGEPTTWAKWSERYFNSDEGWVDACLNAAEVLMYLKVTMEITGEEGRWKEAYDSLVEKGYADLTELHYERMVQGARSMCSDYYEEIMYGDHFLATAAFYGLCTLEKDEKLLAKYKNGFKSWRSSIAHEFNPGYDFPFLAACPEEELDMDRITVWFDRINPSRIASRVSTVGRHDVPVITRKAGYKQCGFVLPPDERFVSKLDRDPLEYKDEDSGGAAYVENCYYYTYPYWMGRYYGFIKEEE